MNMVRIAKPEDAERINELRRQVNDLHVAGRPNHFKAGFGEELQKHVYMYLTDGIGYAAVDEEDGQITGMVMVDYIDRPESPYRYAERFAHIAEICVDEQYRRRGVGKRLLLDVPYPLWDKVSYAMKNLPLLVEDTSFGASVEVTVLIRVNDLDEVTQKLTALTDAKAEWLELDELHYPWPEEE